MVKGKYICDGSICFISFVKCCKKNEGGLGSWLVKPCFAQIINNCNEIQNQYGNSVLWVIVGRDASVTALYDSMAKFLHVSLSQVALIEDRKTTLLNSFMK